jgi:hypothetical protein
MPHAIVATSAEAEELLLIMLEEIISGDWSQTTML